MYKTLAKSPYHDIRESSVLATRIINNASALLPRITFGDFSPVVIAPPQSRLVPHSAQNLPPRQRPIRFAPFTIGRTHHVNSDGDLWAELARSRPVSVSIVLVQSTALGQFGDWLTHIVASHLSCSLVLRFAIGFVAVFGTSAMLFRNKGTSM